MSDLHISKKNLKDIKIVLDALWKDVTSIEASFDYVLFSGDLIYHGNQGRDVEYGLAKTEFLDVLSAKTGVPKEKIIIAPGNHEMNRDCIDRFIDADLSDKFKSREEVNEVIDNLDKRMPLFGRVADFNEFRKEFTFDNPNIIRDTLLGSSYVFEQEGAKIGVACMNTAWASYGGDEDYGKLLLGERQVDEAIADIKACDIKIALFHHPIDWLKLFDKNSVYQRLITEFDLILYGHMHMPDGKQLICNDHSAVLLQCASLFLGRAYNGYTVIKVDLDTRNVDVYFREYFEGVRRVFGEALRIAPNGHECFTLKGACPIKKKRN